METHFPGATPYCHFYVTDEDGALVDPSAITVTIYDPNGTAVDSDKACTQIDTGEYYYAGWTVATTSLTGIYTWIPKSTDGTIVTRNKKYNFLVEKETGD